MAYGQAANQANYNELVRNAQVVRHFETVYIPGLLQIPDYARRVLSEILELLGIAVYDIDAGVAARMQRQQYLYDTSKQFEFLLAEPVLRWLLCPPQIMYAQLDRLQTIFGMPNVRLGIIPLNIELHTAPQHSFQLYDNQALVETFVGETSYDKNNSKAYAAVMDSLWDQAVTGNKARQLIVHAAEHLAPSA